MIHNGRIDFMGMRRNGAGYEANGLRNVRQIARRREMENPRYLRTAK